MQGAVGVLTYIQLQIYRGNFSVIFLNNWLRFDRIMVMSLWHHFWPVMYIGVNVGRQLGSIPSNNFAARLLR